MLKYFEKLSKKFSIHLVFWVFLFTITIATFVDNSMRNRMLPTHPYVKNSPKIQESLKNNKNKSESRLFIYFIDALRYDYAIDKEKMPFLNSLIPQSTWGKVTPCLTNMTVHCVEAAFSGHDRSSILSFSEDFHPRKATNSHSWMFQMKGMGYKVAAVSDHVFPALYGDVLTKNFVYKKGADQAKLTEKALKWFDNPDISVSIVHLLGPHDLGQTYGGNSKQYISQLKIVDNILKTVVDRIKPTDSLLVFGDHGINDVGQHTYNTDTPTFYLYRGPLFKQNHKQDINIGSHTFFLTVLFHLSFPDNYQGEVYWDAFKKTAIKDYGNKSLFKLKRAHNKASVKLKPLQIFLLLVIFVLIFFTVLLWFSGSKAPPLFVWPFVLISLITLFLVDWFWALPFIVLPSLFFFFKEKPKFRFILFSLALILFAIIKAILYRHLDLAVHDLKIYFIYSFYLIEIVISFLIAKYTFKIKNIWRNTSIIGVILGLILLIFHYPTLYFYGVIRGIPFFLILISSFYTIEIILNSENRKNSILPLKFVILGLILTVLFLSTQISMLVENFRIFYFLYIPKTWSSSLEAIWAITPFIFSTLLLSYIYKIKSAKSIIALLLISVVDLILIFGFLPIHSIIFAFLLLFIITVWFFPFSSILDIPKPVIMWLILIPELAYMHQFNPGAIYQLTGFAFVTGFLFSIINPKNSSFFETSKISIPFIMLVIITLVVAFGFRTCGIDYKFAIKWFPTMFERLWGIIFISDIIKYFFGIAILSLFFKTNGQNIIRLSSFILGTLVMVLVPLLISMFLFETKVPLVVDTLEETIYMTGTLLFLGLLSFTMKFILPKTNSKIRHNSK